jgi:hypothetical protein
MQTSQNDATEQLLVIKKQSFMGASCINRKFEISTYVMKKRKYLNEIYLQPL